MSQVYCIETRETLVKCVLKKGNSFNFFYPEFKPVELPNPTMMLLL